MIKKLTKHGNSMALVIDKPTMETLGIQADTPLQITVTASGLHVTRADIGIGKERLDMILRDVRAQYGPALKRLAE